MTDLDFLDVAVLHLDHLWLLWHVYTRPRRLNGWQAWHSKRLACMVLRAQADVQKE